jgi:hypothetical protein
MSLVLLCGLVFGLLALVGIGWGIFLLLVQLGVIVKEAQKPQHVDTFDYSLSQGREVDIRHQDDNPIYITQENQANEKPKNDWEL